MADGDGSFNPNRMEYRPRCSLIRPPSPPHEDEEDLDRLFTRTSRIGIGYHIQSPRTSPSTRVHDPEPATMTLPFTSTDQIVRLMEADDIIEYMRCSLCRKIPPPHLTLVCRIGHFLCQYCYTKLPRTAGCPHQECSNEVTPARGEFFHHRSQLYNQLYFNSVHTCEFYEEGCLHYTLGINQGMHRRVCVYRPTLSCEVSRCNAGRPFAFKTYIAHLVKDHKVPEYDLTNDKEQTARLPVERVNNNMKYDKSNPDFRWVCALLTKYGKVFMVIGEEYAGGVAVWISNAPPKPEDKGKDKEKEFSDSFEYIIKVLPTANPVMQSRSHSEEKDDEVNGSNDRSILSWEGLVQPFGMNRATIVAEGACLTIAKGVFAKKFLYNSESAFYWDADIGIQKGDVVENSNALSGLGVKLTADLVPDLITFTDTDFATPDQSHEPIVLESAPELKTQEEWTIKSATPEKQAAESDPEKGTTQLAPGEGTAESGPEERTTESEPEGTMESAPEEGTTESAPEKRATESAPEGTTESAPEGTTESAPEGTTESAPEGTTESALEIGAIESPPEEGTTESALEIGAIESPPEEGTTESAPEERTTESAPGGTTESTSELKTQEEWTIKSAQEGLSESAPKERGTESAPEKRATESDPEKGTIESAPEVGTTESSLDERTTESAPKIGAIESAPEVGTTESSLDERTTESAPEIGAIESAPEKRTTESAPEKGITESAPEIGAIESAPELKTQEEWTVKSAQEGIFESAPEEGTTESAPEGTTESAPEGTTESAPEGTTESAPEEGATESAPEKGITEAAPEIGVIESTPDLKTQEEWTIKSAQEGLFESAPEERGTESAPEKRATESALEKRTTESAPEGTTESAPEERTTESASKEGATESAPEIGAIESAPEERTTESAPVERTTESAPEEQTTKSTCVAGTSKAVAAHTVVEIFKPKPGKKRPVLRRPYK